MADLKMQARLARRALRRGLARVRFTVSKSRQIAEMPRFFLNSFPKSGTHLLTQVVGGLSKLGPVVESGLPAVLTFEGESGRPRPVDAIVKDVQRLLPGDIGYGHVHAFPALVAELCRDGTANYFIYRDPRDVAVSHVFYVSELNAQHVHHDYYVNTLKTFDERLRVSILGRPEAEQPFPGIGERFAPYLGWLERNEVLALRFEDFIEAPRATIDRILTHAEQRGFRYRGTQEAAVEMLARSIDPQRSPTFRSGRAGAWREHFTEAHKELFKQVCGGLLERLRYEENGNW
ncbi:MAG: hypothetical protein DWG76_02025 [Chloroflexi bacterium]|nr:hypothetical protein [Chloroflexota bacterium]